MGLFYTGATAANSPKMSTNKQYKKCPDIAAGAL